MRIGGLSCFAYCLVALTLMLAADLKNLLALHLHITIAETSSPYRYVPTSATALYTEAPKVGSLKMIQEHLEQEEELTLIACATHPVWPLRVSEKTRMANTSSPFLAEPPWQHNILAPPCKISESACLCRYGIATLWDPLTEGNF